MKKNKNFEEILNTINENQYIGLGNPNAKILFIGKEAGTEIQTKIYHGSVKSWKEKEFNYFKKYIPKEKKLRNLNHTWQRYQKLYDCILSSLDKKRDFDKNDKYEINFVENVFTTELSNLHAPNTMDAKKQKNFNQELKTRKKVFFQSEFIKQFPIIVIFASDNQYIETYRGEVCKLFGVKFYEELSCGKRDKIWVHYSEKEDETYPKLVIHTRQLTNGASIDLLKKIAEIVAGFIKKYSIEIKVK